MSVEEEILALRRIGNFHRPPETRAKFRPGGKKPIYAFVYNARKTYSGNHITVYTDCYWLACEDDRRFGGIRIDDLSVYHHNSWRTFHNKGKVFGCNEASGWENLEMLPRLEGIHGDLLDKFKDEGNLYVG